MTWNRQQYEDRIRDRLGDLGILQHISETSIPLSLEAALATFTKDRPREHRQTFSGDGANQTFDLGGDDAWAAGWSRVDSVEHPTGNIPKTLLNSHDWSTDLNDLLIISAPATGAGNIIVRHSALWDFPDDDASDDTNPIPEVYTQAIADLAASRISRGKATEYARQQSTSVAGDLFVRDPAPLFQAAADWRKEYESTVIGRPDTEDGATQVAMAVETVDVFPASIFHRQADYISDEALGD